MAQTVSGSNVCIKVGDPIALTISTTGDVVAEVGDTAKFMIKLSPYQSDDSAVVSKDITVTVDNEIPIYVSSADTEKLDEGTYYWSVKHYKDGEEYTIIPDSGCSDYPTFKIYGRLING